MKAWIIFVVFYGILKGAREPIKKNVLKNCSVLSTLFVYTLIGFVFTVPGAEGIFSASLPVFLLTIVKSVSVFTAWILAFDSLKKVPVSLYGVVDMSRVIFSTLMGVVFLSETLTVKGVAGLVLVIAGLCLVNRKRENKGEQYEGKYIVYILISCALNAVSGTLDKYIMSTGEMTSSALQFWFMLMLSVMYFLYMVARREKIEFVKCIKNPWIYILSLMLVFGDRLLFIANSDPQSKVTVMTLIKQSSAIVTIICGKLIYKEKNILYKLACAAVILLGIMVAVV